MTDWVMVPRDLWRRLTDGEVIDPAELVELAAAPHKTAEPVAYPMQECLPDMERQALDKAVTAMAAKLYRKYLEGYSGFDNCSEERLNALLHSHLAKGDPIDVANFAAFLHFNGQRTNAAPQQTAEPVAFADEHVDTFLTQYNDVYCHQRKAGVGGGNAERAAMRQVLILALGAYKPRITAEQVAELKRLADEYAHVYSFVEGDDMPIARTALHAALDALTKGTP